MTLPTIKSESHPHWLGGQIKLINFIPQSTVPNIVEGFYDIKEGHYYIFAPIEAFHDGLREAKKMVMC